MRKIGTKGLDIIKRFEGLSYTSYRCPAGVWTIGYGHTRGVKEGDEICDVGAEELLKKDVESAERAVNTFVDVDLTQEQFDALVSFVFNLGVGNFKKSTLLRKLNKEDYKGAAKEFPRWNKAGGRELRGLTRRRNAEMKLFNGEK